MLQNFRRILVVSLGISCVTVTHAQHDNFAKMVDFMPPPPNASAILKYGGISLNKNTGSPNVSIPLFTLPGRKLSVSASLGYASSGIKVDEIASRVGMGWALNAGGVVTRTMRGVPDEWNTRLLPTLPIAANCGSYNNLKKIATSYDVFIYHNGYDAEPDLFNFNMNGISGTFVFDENMQPVLKGVEKYKVQYDFSPTASWNFKITTTDGVAYYFGGTAVEKSKRENTCGRTYEEYLPSSWYLTKMEHPNGEVINFTYLNHTYTYDNGVSQTMHWAWFFREFNTAGQFTSTCDNECNIQIPSTKCINRVNTQGVLLNTIFNDHGTIQFSYTTREDCTDKLVSEVRMLDNPGNLIGLFNFYYTHVTSNALYEDEYAWGHNKTPYLIELQELSTDLLQTKTHRFGYIDPANRAPRLSFSQDHWGYFNGQVNNVFIPLPEDLAFRNKFPQATANREPDELYAQKGLLSRIVYPTGGMDSILYESNSIASNINVAPRHTLVCEVTGAGTHTQVLNTPSISIAYEQLIELQVNCIDNTGNGGFDPTHNKGKVEIHNSSGSPVYSELFTPGNSVNRVVSLLQGNYTVKLYANGTAVTTRINLKHYPVNIATAGNKPVGGLRVKSVITGSQHDKPVVKKYYYGELNSLNVSSLSAVQWPRYHKDYKVSEPCEALFSGGGSTITIQSYCSRTAMYSNSINNLYDYQSSPVSYVSVVEGIGENFEGGAVQTRFNTGADAKGVVIWGEDILGAPLTNYSAIFNGRPKEEIILKRSATGTLFPLKKTLYTYKIDTAGQRIISGYSVAQKYTIYVTQPTPECSGSTPVTEELINAFDVLRYDFVAWWVYMDTLTEINYDENGQNPLTKQTLFYYDNALHHQLTRTQTANSKGEIINTVNTYPHDHTAQTVYADMVNRNIISPIVGLKTFNGSIQSQNQLSELKTNYADWGNGNYLPATIQRSVKNGPLETEGTIDQYDNLSNILQYTGKDGVVNAIIWGYASRYPVAKITGATYSQAISALGMSTQALQTANETDLRAAVNNIRTSLPGALVTTHTYKRLVGVTGITDPNNRTATYSYDAFNRLLEVKDPDGNVLKRMSYYYASSIPSAGFGVHYNQPQSAPFTPQQCQSGYTSYNVTYTVPYGKYTSYVDVTEANAMALADIAANGQAYANRFADCSTDGPCYGVMYKKVNCKCELGLRINSGSYQNANGTWTCIYYYRWSDNTRSPDQTEITATNCMDIGEL